MNKVFIVRPFGQKSGVDFNRVHHELVTPALELLGLQGDTTEAIIEAGNIREDMFAQLLLADLVVADVSIHNANVFYELGIRHALRDKKTFLIRCSKDEIPFDLKTDRYLRYDENDPGASVEQLKNALEATLLSDRQDSPVFYMLPKLEAQNPEHFLAVPPSFGEEVAIATEARQIGKLALLAYEASGFPWELPALRLLGEALFKVKDLEASAICWQKIRDRFYYDSEANDRLATIYQRQAEDIFLQNPQAGWELLARSDAAIERLLAKTILTPNKLAEVWALKGRNAKTRWVDTWRKTPKEEWKKNALQSTYLLDSYQFYNKAFTDDLNHYYSGINALGLLTIIISLAEALPDVFAVEYDTDEEASLALKRHHQRQQELCVLVQASINAERLRKPNEMAIWLNITEADLSCLTSDKPLRVGSLYRKVLQEATAFNLDSARRQLELYAELDVKSENVAAALAEFEALQQVVVHTQRHYLLFTGHMIDKANRPEPRFPPSIENKVKEEIKARVQLQKDKYGDALYGISGGACGGDILFHEVCLELNIPTEMYLVLPRPGFLAESVQFAGPQWVDRFDELYNKLPCQQLAEKKELPRWLRNKPNYSIWERNNLWMLNSALVAGGIHLTMMALWDGTGGDGPGGTGHMVQQAIARGAKVDIIDINLLRV